MMEKRLYRAPVELRAAAVEGEPEKIIGTGAVFGPLSELMYGFRERVTPTAFAKADLSDTRGLFNHMDEYVLGSVRAGTLRLDVTERGIEYEIDAPETQLINDLVLEPMRRGDIRQSSFGFTLLEDGDEFIEEDGEVIRELRAIEKLWDVSPVTFPAYPDADSGLGKRTLEKYRDFVSDHRIEEDPARVAVRRAYWNSAIRASD